jgi:hypothetical protein
VEHPNLTFLVDVIMAQNDSALDNTIEGSFLQRFFLGEGYLGTSVCVFYGFLAEFSQVSDLSRLFSPCRLAKSWMWRSIELTEATRGGAVPDVHVIPRSSCNAIRRVDVKSRHPR